MDSPVRSQSRPRTPLSPLSFNAPSPSSMRKAFRAGSVKPISIPSSGKENDASGPHTPLDESFSMFSSSPASNANASLNFSLMSSGLDIGRTPTTTSTPDFMSKLDAYLEGKTVSSIEKSQKGRHKPGSIPTSAQSSFLRSSSLSSSSRSSLLRSKRKSPEASTTAKQSQHFEDWAKSHLCTMKTMRRDLEDNITDCRRRNLAQLWDLQRHRVEKKGTGAVGGLESGGVFEVVGGCEGAIVDVDDVEVEARSGSDLETSPERLPALLASNVWKDFGVSDAADRSQYSGGIDPFLCVDLDTEYSPLSTSPTNTTDNARLSSSFRSTVLAAKSDRLSTSVQSHTSSVESLILAAVSSTTESNAQNSTANCSNTRRRFSMDETVENNSSSAFSLSAKGDAGKPKNSKRRGFFRRFRRPKGGEKDGVEENGGLPPRAPGGCGSFPGVERRGEMGGEITSLLDTEPGISLALSVSPAPTRHSRTRSLSHSHSLPTHPSSLLRPTHSRSHSFDANASQCFADSAVSTTNSLRESDSSSSCTTTTATTTTITGRSDSASGEVSLLSKALSGGDRVVQSVSLEHVGVQESGDVRVGVVGVDVEEGDGDVEDVLNTSAFCYGSLASDLCALSDANATQSNLSLPLSPTLSLARTQERDAKLSSVLSSILLAKTFEHWKCHTSNAKLFAAQKVAATKIQSRWRTSVQQSEYSRMCRAVRTVQRVFRGFQVRQQLCKMHSSALRIQSWVRCHSERQRFVEVRRCVVAIQAMWRMRSARAEFVEVCGAAVAMQSMVRMRKERSNYLRLRGSAVCVQSVLRMRRQRTSFLQQRKAAILLQSMFRMHEQQSQYRRLRTSATLLQATFRVYKQRSEYLQVRESATALQSVFRMHKERSYYMKLRASAIVLQSAFRMYKERSAFRRLRVSATAVQSVFRMYKERSAFQKLRVSATAVQSVFRMYKERSAFLKLSAASTALQSVLRMRTERTRYLELRSAATVLQSVFRMHMQHSEFVHLKDSAVVVQSAFRMYMERSNFLKWRDAALVVQSSFRMYRERSEYTKLRSGVVALQSVFRMHREMHEFQCLRRGTVALQSLARMRSERSAYQKLRKSAIVLQSLVRMHRERSAYQRLRSSAIVLQSLVRMRSERSAYQKLRESAIVLQSLVRMRSERSAYQKLQGSAILFQSLVRMHRERSAYQQLQDSAIVLQSLFRMHKEQRSYQQFRCSVILVQSLWRRWSARTAFRKTVESVVRIQSAVRMAACRREFMATAAAVRVIQRAVRSFLARRSDQPLSLSLSAASVANNSVSDAQILSESATAELSMSDFALSMEVEVDDPAAPLHISTSEVESAAANVQSEPILSACNDAESPRKREGDDGEAVNETFYSALEESIYHTFVTPLGSPGVTHRVPSRSSPFATAAPVSINTSVDEVVVERRSGSTSPARMTLAERERRSAELIESLCDESEAVTPMQILAKEVSTRWALYSTKSAGSRRQSIEGPHTLLSPSVTWDIEASLRIQTRTDEPSPMKSVERRKPQPESVELRAFSKVVTLSEEDACILDAFAAISTPKNAFEKLLRLPIASVDGVCIRDRYVDRLDCSLWNSYVPSKARRNRRRAAKMQRRRATLRQQMVQKAAERQRRMEKRHRQRRQPVRKEGKDECSIL